MILNAHDGVTSGSASAPSVRSQPGPNVRRVTYGLRIFNGIMTRKSHSTDSTRQSAGGVGVATRDHQSRGEKMPRSSPSHTGDGDSQALA